MKIGKVYIKIESSNNNSSLNYVNISNFSYFDNGKIQLTGGLNFMNQMEISNSIINNSMSEDAINFVKSEFRSFII